MTIIVCYIADEISRKVTVLLLHHALFKYCHNPPDRVSTCRKATVYLKTILSG